MPSARLFHLGGGRNEQARQQWMDTGRSRGTRRRRSKRRKTGKQMIEGRNVTGGALKWCAWGAADGTDDDQPDGQIAAATVAMIEKLGDTPWFIGCGFHEAARPVHRAEEVLRPVSARVAQALDAIPPT